MGLVDAKNKVPEHQRFYQAAYAQHVRIWRIAPRSRAYLIPYLTLLYGTGAATMYAAGRKILGYNSFFGD